MKRYFDLPEARRVMEINANGMMAGATVEQIGAQAGTRALEVDAYKYAAMKMEYEKPEHQRAIWEGKP